jgi:FkbM family methyltransferase
MVAETTASDAPIKRRVSILGRTSIICGEGDYIKSMQDGVYFEDTIGAFLQLVKSDGVALDIGANIGITAMALATIASKGRVVAVEADRRNYADLTRNIDVNGFDNVVPLQHLVGVDGASKTFLYNVINPACSTSTSRENAAQISRRGNLEEVYFTCKSLDRIVADQGLSRLDFIKMDVDGGELDVLAGAGDTLRRFKPTVVVEFSALCLMNFARINPPEALSRIKTMFPSVRRIAIHKGRVTFEPIDEYEFIYSHVMYRSCVDNLVCSFVP